MMAFVREVMCCSSCSSSMFSVSGSTSTKIGVPLLYELLVPASDAQLAQAGQPPDRSGPGDAAELAHLLRTTLDDLVAERDLYGLLLIVALDVFLPYNIAFKLVTISGQSMLVVLSSLILIGVLYLFFERTLYGKALRATALNRVGARLVGISPSLAGSVTFMLAALLGAFSGVLIGPITTVYYDSGFLISLKGFVGGIIGGLASYPIAAAGSVLVGLLESFSSFWASAFKEVIVFTLIIPVLLWRSLTTHHHEEEE